MTKPQKTLGTLKNSILIFIIFSVLIIALLFTCCVSTSIEDVKTADNVGKKVTVRGTVENSIKIGELSGYTLKDESGTIRISSESLPEEGTTKTVSGTLIKDTLFGYYIKVN